MVAQHAEPQPGALDAYFGGEAVIITLCAFAVYSFSPLTVPGRGTVAAVPVCTKVSSCVMLVLTRMSPCILSNRSYPATLKALQGPPAGSAGGREGRG